MALLSRKKKAMLCWISCKADNSRVGKARQVVPLEFILPDSVLPIILHVGTFVNRLQNLVANPSRKQVSDALEDLDKKVIGLAYLRFKYAYDIDKLLSGPQRHAMDFWMAS